MTAHTEGLDVAALRRAHAGTVHAPGDDGWDAARAAWNLAVDQRPAAVAVPAEPEDVAAAVGFAAERGLCVRAQSTGHGAAGSLEGALLIDMSGMRGVEVDPGRRLARIQAGARWGDVLGAAAPHGLTGLHGSSGTVGVAGYTLGGGLGPLGRRNGLACNGVTAVELVDARGRPMRASADEEPELFWALRGGGGSFGVVTALEFRLVPLETAYAGNLFWPIERAPEVMAAYAGWAPEAPDDVTASLRLMRLPPIPQVPEPLRGGAFVNLLATVIGDEARGRELLRPLREVAPALIDTFAEVPAAALGEVAGDPVDPVPALADGTLLRGLPPEAVEALLGVAGPGASTPLLQVELRQLGGALAEPPPGHGALDRLDGAFLLYGVGLAMGPDGARAVGAALADVCAAAAPWATGRRCLNFAEGGTDPSTLFSPEAYARLRAVRRAVDPDGIFRANHPIAPS